MLIVEDRTPDVIILPLVSRLTVVAAPPKVSFNCGIDVTFILAELPPPVIPPVFNVIISPVLYPEPAFCGVTVVILFPETTIEKVAPDPPDGTTEACETT